MAPGVQVLSPTAVPKLTGVGWVNIEDSAGQILQKQHRRPQLQEEVIEPEALNILPIKTRRASSNVVRLPIQGSPADTQASTNSWSIMASVPAVTHRQIYHCVDSIGPHRFYIGPRLFVRS